jgi:hypothetical protein
LGTRPKYKCPKNTASKLAGAGELSVLNFPYPPICFHPFRRGIDLIRTAKTTADEKPDFQPYILSTMDVHYQWTHKVPLKPEESICRLNLDYIMQKLLTICQAQCSDEVQKNKITTQSASAAMSALKFVTNNSSFANKSTLPEPILLYKLNNNSLGLITSEAKAVTDSCSVTFAQAIQVASDCALQTFNYMQANDKSVTYEDVVVPFVVAASDKVQFGVVYLIQNNFPNSCLLSEEISLLNPDGRVEISRWLFALSKLVHHYLGLFPSLLSKKTSSVT